MADENGSGEETGNPQGSEAQAGQWGTLDPDTRSFVEKKGWKSPADVVGSYRNLEKTFGHPQENILLKPDFDNPEAAAKFYDAVGRPQAPDQYSFPKAENIPVDERSEQWFRQAAHENGLTQRQAAKLYESWNKTQEDQARQLYADAERQEKADEAALRVDWGGAYDAKMKAARMALNAFAGDAEQANRLLDKLEGSDVFGRTEIYRFLSSVGEKLVEDSSDGTGGSSFAMGSIDAKERIKDLRNNADFVNKLYNPTAPGHRDAKDEWSRLHELAYG